MGAQVPVTVGLSEKPLSSRNTKVASRARAFFDAWPGVLEPVLDRCLVAFLGFLGGALITPPTLTKQRANVIAIVGDFETIFDQIGNALSCPKVVGITEG